MRLLASCASECVALAPQFAKSRRESERRTHQVGLPEPRDEFSPQHSRSPTAGSTAYPGPGCMSGLNSLFCSAGGRLWPRGADSYGPPAVSAHRGTPAECESRRLRWAPADSPPARRRARGWWGRWRPEGVGIGHAPVPMLRQPSSRASACAAGIRATSAIERGDGPVVVVHGVWNACASLVSCSPPWGSLPSHSSAAAGSSDGTRM